MAKGDTWRRELGPESFFSQPKLDLPTWTLGIIPMPPPKTPSKLSPEEVQEFTSKFQEFGCKAQKHYNDCDRIKKEYLLREWCRFLDVDNSDDALWELGKRMGFPAFHMADDTRGRPKDALGPKIQLTIAVYDLLNSGAAPTVIEALKILINSENPPEIIKELKKQKKHLARDQNELERLEKKVSRIHAGYKKSGSRLFNKASSKN